MSNADPCFSDKSSITEVEEDYYEGGVISDTLALVHFKKITYIMGFTSFLSCVP